MGHSWQPRPLGRWWVADALEQAATTSPQPAPAAEAAAWPRVTAVIAGLLVLAAAEAAAALRRRLDRGPATAP
jgi:hypothetical protein